MKAAAAAHVATDRPALYLKQLCEHFAGHGQRHSAQEFHVTFDDREGFIDFAPAVSGTCRVDARRDDVLVVEVTASDQAALERVQRIVTKHLERFGRGDGVTVGWGPVADVPRRDERRSAYPDGR